MKCGRQTRGVLETSRDTAMSRVSPHVTRPRAALDPRAADQGRGADRARAIERRRRERHFQRRRRDLLEDTALALLITVVLISITAGLGVLTLIILPAAGLMAAAGLAMRVRRARRHATERRSRRSGALQTR
jgi:hypothetical protein